MFFFFILFLNLKFFGEFTNFHFIPKLSNSFKESHLTTDLQVETENVKTRIRKTWTYEQFFDLFRKLFFPKHLQ